MTLLFFLFAMMNTGELASDPFPGVPRDAAIPTAETILGFDFGEQIATHGEVMAYSRALANASDRVSLVAHGMSWEGRQMFQLWISTPENLNNLETLQKDWLAIADPRKTDEAAFKTISETLPTLVWLNQSVHGNEISGTDSGMLLAWHMASAQDEATAALLKNSVLVIEMMQNPDGRDRFINFTRQRRSPLGPNGHGVALERDEPWQSGRANHYLFDMNRDWFAMTQPETEHKVKSFLEWMPHVVVDLHEMSGEATFFAANPAEPANPLLSPDMRNGYKEIGQSIGNLFDERKLDYFHGEIFDSFYPGYGESWPSLHGALGILFEQGSARGLMYKRSDGQVLTHMKAVQNQMLGSYAVLKHAADRRQETLRDFYDRRREPLNVKGEEQVVFLLPGKDGARLKQLGDLIRKQGIEIVRLTEAVRNVNARPSNEGAASKQDIPVGSLMVRLNQPAGRLARTLLADNVPLDPAFLDEEKARWEKKRARTRIYDVTGWSLPLLYGVDARYTKDRVKAEGSDDLTPAFSFKHKEASLAYLIPPSLHTYPVLSALLQDGYRVSYNEEAIVYKGQTFDPGTLIVRRGDNPDTVVDRLQALSDAWQVNVVGIDSSWFDKGPSLGSGKVSHIHTPKVLILWDRPTSTLSAGWMRFVMEQRFKYPVTVVRTSSLRRVKLHDFNVILMPEGYDWSGALGSMKGRLKTWVRDGGTLVTVGASTEWLTEEGVGLLDSTTELAGGIVENGDKKDTHPKKPEKDPKEMIKPHREHPGSSFGALLRVAFDNSHWSAFGMASEQAVMTDSNRIMRPLRLDDGTNVGRYVDKDNLVLAGYVMDASIEQFSHKPFMMVTSRGRGNIIAFTEDINYRAFTRGLEPLLGNAVFFGAK